MSRRTLEFLQNCSAIFGLALLFAAGTATLRDWAAKNDVTRSFLEDGTNELAAEEIAATYDGVFHATVYYTPLETAFTADSGYDVTQLSKPGLSGKRFGRDFLKAVELEGFGRMNEPVNGKAYLSCCRGVWGFADTPLDSLGRPLRALRSSAVGAEHEWIGTRTAFRVRATGAPKPFTEARWEICDTGAGLQPQQIDFYWGEDAPLGPGRRMSRPKGMPDAIVNPTVLVLR